MPGIPGIENGLDWLAGLSVSLTVPGASEPATRMAAASSEPGCVAEEEEAVFDAAAWAASASVADEGLEVFEETGSSEPEVPEELVVSVVVFWLI